MKTSREDIMTAFSIGELHDSTGTVPTAVVSPFPIPIHKGVFTSIIQAFSWEEQLPSDYYVIDIEYYDPNRQIEIIQEFALNLIKNSREMDPEISKVVNDNFWDLL
jgi:hypothetical protein